MKFHKALCLLASIAPVALTAETPIEGLWKHCKKPAWVTISFQSGIGKGSIQAHAQNEDAKGLLLLRNIVLADATSSKWNGEMYSASSGSFVSVNILLESEGEISIYQTIDANESILCLSRQ